MTSIKLNLIKNILIRYDHPVIINVISIESLNDILSDDIKNI